MALQVICTVMAVELVIVVAPMSVAAASVTATVRVLRFAVCVVAGELSPVGTITVHAVEAGSAAVAAVNTREAAAWPWFDLDCVWATVLVTAPSTHEFT